MEFVFDACSSGEVQSWNISVVKGALTTKIKACSYMLVIIGSEANKLHKDYQAIGYRNWQNFEIARAKAAGVKLVAVKLDYTFDSPEQLYGAGAAWAYGFQQDKIIKALNEA